MSTSSDKTAETRAQWSLRVLGGFDLSATPGGRVALPGKRERILLAYLALSPMFRQSRRKLAGLLWSDATDETALDKLRTCVWGLRRALGDTGRSFVVSEGDDISLNMDAFHVDAAAFLALAAQSGRAELEAAADFYAGEFLSGLVVETEEFESWRRAEAARYRNLAIKVLTRLMTQLEECGDTERAIEIGVRIVGIEPLHEPATRRLMRLYGRSGRRGAAIQLYRALAAALRAELDAEPEAATRSVLAEIARGGEENRPVPSMILPARVSLAVLPFANMSADPAQEFFSDGMTEEITAVLAKVPNLRVVARTSAFQFKGRNEDVRAVGRSLSATHLLEGSVRKAGDRIRITAQLINAQDGTHLWSENYDRQLPDVFAIQESIAQAIAAALQVPLGLREGQHLILNRTADTESYQDYLRARALVRVRGPLEPGGPLTDAAKLLERVVARDPNYAPAWGLLGQACALTPGFSAALVNGVTDELQRFTTESLDRAEAAAQQATRLDPNNIDGYVALAFARNYRGGFAQAEDLFKQALSLDPGNPEAIHQYSLMLAGVGRLKDALPMRLGLQAQEPLVPVFNRATAEALWLTGRNDEAIALLKSLPATFGPLVRLAEVYASMGCYSEAADSLRTVPAGVFPKQTLENAAHLLGSAPAQAPSPQPLLSATRLGFVYLYIGAHDRVLDFFERLAETSYPAVGNPASRLWAAPYAPVRKTERFKSFVRRAGMVDYWRARGWADLCRPLGVDDFICD